MRTVSPMGASCEKPGDKTHVQRENEKWKTVKEACARSDVGSGRVNSEKSSMAHFMHASSGIRWRPASPRISYKAQAFRY